MMKVIVPGHVYEVSNVDDPEVTQRLLFIEKESVGAAGEKLATVRDGTTTEQVLQVVIDRLQTLNARLPDDATHKAITCVGEALTLLEQRRYDRAQRGVLGTHLA